MKRIFLFMTAIVIGLSTMAQNSDDNNTDGGGIPYPPTPLYWSTSGNSITEDMGLSIGSTSGCSFRMKTNDTIRMYIDSTGRVGIGTEEPFQMLHVVGGNIMISKSADRAPGSTNGSLMFGGDVTNSNQHGNYAIEYVNSETEGYGLNFWKPHVGSRTAINNVLFLTTSGKVGIGTNNPQAKLAVNGRILAKSIKLSLNSTDWPDYVFTPEYDRMSLSELEAYITTNRHLPGVPSAADVKEQEGIVLEEMNAILLQKVEELTLYIIELQKQINELKENAKNE